MLQIDSTCDRTSTLPPSAHFLKMVKPTMAIERRLPVFAAVQAFDVMLTDLRAMAQEMSASGEAVPSEAAIVALQSYEKFLRQLADPRFGQFLDQTMAATIGYQGEIQLVIRWPRLNGLACYVTILRDGSLRSLRVITADGQILAE